MPDILLSTVWKTLKVGASSYSMENQVKCYSEAVRIQAKNPIVIYVGCQMSKVSDWWNSSACLHKIYVEDKIVIDYELKFPEEIVEIELFRDNLQNDEVIQISICIDCLWCPANINMGSDTRNLGLLIQNVEICDK